MGKMALVLSGGGAKGAFQAGAERYAREVKGYRWDIIAGVLVGEMALGRWPTVWECLVPISQSCATRTDTRGHSFAFSRPRRNVELS